MAFEYINPLAAIWLARGLRHILAPEMLSRPHNTLAADSGEQRPGPGKWSQRPQAEPAERTTRIEPLKRTWQPIPVAQWPHVWQDQLAGARKGRIAWTYAQLGDDLRAGKTNTKDAETSGRAQRSRFLRRALADLKHPQGTHTFWPAQLPAALTPEPEIFWSGLKELDCRGAIIMGLDFASLLIADGVPRPYTQVKFRGQFVWILPEIENIPEEDYTRMFNFLKRALQPFTRS